MKKILLLVLSLACFAGCKGGNETSMSLEDATQVESTRDQAVDQVKSTYIQERTSVTPQKYRNDRKGEVKDTSRPTNGKYQNELYYCDPYYKNPYNNCQIPREPTAVARDNSEKEDTGVHHRAEPVRVDRAFVAQGYGERCCKPRVCRVCTCVPCPCKPRRCQPCYYPSFNRGGCENKACKCNPCTCNPCKCGTVAN